MRNPLSSFSSLVNIILFTVFLSTFDVIINSISKGYFVVKYLLILSGILNSSFEGVIDFLFPTLLFIDFLLSFYLLWLLLQFGKLFYSAKPSSFFSTKNGKIFEIIGKGMILYTALILPVRILLSSFEKNTEFGDLINYSLERNIIEVINAHYPSLIIAVFILIISHLIRDGRLLKKENDLTI